MRFRRGLVVCIVVALLLLPGGGAAWSAGTVVGGGPVQVQSAPWEVLIDQETSWGVARCGGSIIDPVHVLTAAHCAFDLSGAQLPPTALSVRAGISSSSAPLRTDSEQDRSVSSVAVYPGYVWTGGPSANDVAMLTLAQPLSLGAPTAQAVALPRAGAPFPAGVEAGVAGFGREAAGAPSDGSLHQASFVVGTQASCASVAATLIESTAASLCAGSPGSSICAGDSGSGLVTTGSPPTLIGVVSAGPRDCGAGSQGLFTWVGAPQILDFIDSGRPQMPASASTSTPASAPATPRSQRQTPSRAVLHRKRRSDPPRTAGAERVGRALLGIAAPR